MLPRDTDHIANRNLVLFFHSLLADPNSPRKRRSRWGEQTKTDIPGLPTAIAAAGVSQAQLDNYAIHVRLEEINRKLRLNDFIPPERERYVLTNVICRILTNFFVDPPLPRPPTMPMAVGPIHAKSVTARSLKMNASDLSTRQ